uniref:Major facilitator superfamily (MFS) profile domain-containing protein n=1 Tax=Periophthalmus magnuspinnatus TaxID=409849 RepID=A0A3B3ZFQ2_9GOBI
MAEEGRRSRVKEGGWGWMIVAGCFLANICTRAVTRCVSIFFIEFQQNFGRDYSSTAWIHSTIDGITMFCAPLGGFLGNHFSCRSIVMAGGLLSFTGMVLSSFATSLPYLYVTMGIVTGLGFALSYTPSVAMVGNYFHERKALAYGIGLSGSGIGTFILAPAVQLLIELYSWRGALLVLGGFVANLCVCGALLRPNFLPGDANVPRACIVSPKPCGLCLCLESKEEFRFLFHPDFLILLVSVLFMAFGCSAPLVYLVPYALSVGVDHQNAAFLMSIFGISSIVGNITFGWITDRPFLKKHRLLNYMCAVLMEGLCCMVFPFLLSFPGLAVCVVLYGYFDGAYVALIPVVVSDVVGPSCLTPALGVVYFLHAVPYLVSPPIGGLLVDTTGAYTSTFHLCGASYVISAGILTVAMAAKRWWSSKSTSVV